MPGESYTFKNTGETFVGAPPLDVQDRVMVFGTHEKNPVSWGLFTETAGMVVNQAVERSVDPPVIERGVPAQSPSFFQDWFK